MFNYAKPTASYDVFESTYNGDDEKKNRVLFPDHGAEEILTAILFRQVENNIKIPDQTTIHDALIMFSQNMNSVNPAVNISDAVNTAKAKAKSIKQYYLDELSIKYLALGKLTAWESTLIELLRDQEKVTEDTLRLLYKIGPGYDYQMWLNKLADKMNGIQTNHIKELDCQLDAPNTHNLIKSGDLTNLRFISENMSPFKQEKGSPSYLYANRKDEIIMLYFGNFNSVGNDHKSIRNLANMMVTSKMPIDITYGNVHTRKIYNLGFTYYRIFNPDMEWTKGEKS